MAQATWKMAVVAVVCLVAGLALGGNGLLGSAQAQSAGGASGTICVMGQERNGSAPIVLIDAREQTLMVYEYSYSNDRIELTAARTFAFDKQLPEFNIDGPTVEWVRQRVTRR